MPPTGALFYKAGLSGAFSLLLILISGRPLIGPAALFASVAPQIILVRRGFLPAAIISWALVLGTVYLIGGTDFFAVYGVLFFLYGLWYIKVLSSSPAPGGRIIKASAAWVLLAGILGLGAYFYRGVNLVELFFLDLRISAGGLAGRYIDMGVPEGGEAALSLISLLFKGFGGFLAIASLGGSLLVYWIISRFGGEKALPDFDSFRVPEEIIWVLLGAAALFMAGTTFFPGGIKEMAGANLGIFLLGIYMVGGAALVLFLMRLWRLSPFLRAALFFMLIFLWGGIYIMTILGIADVWIDFREKSSSAKE